VILLYERNSKTALLQNKVATLLRMSEKKPALGGLCCGEVVT
jgi:hypothetical protein